MTQFLCVVSFADNHAASATIQAEPIMSERGYVGRRQCNATIGFAFCGQRAYLLGVPPQSVDCVHLLCQNAFQRRVQGIE